ncbi:hypothetical protein TNCV_560111 [Trichonephila clavipes]|nr:hypothetical protein TNCV_560111 [Trichonephila clavipes]
MRTELHPGVPPPHHGINKGGSVPVIWQKTRHGATEVHPEYNATASGRGIQRVKPDTPLICSTNPTAVSLRDSEERYHQPIDRSGLTPATRLQRSVGQREHVLQTTNACVWRVWPMRRRVNLKSSSSHCHHQAHAPMTGLHSSAVCYPTADSMIPARS